MIVSNRWTRNQINILSSLCEYEPPYQINDISLCGIGKLVEMDLTSGLTLAPSFTLSKAVLLIIRDCVSDTAYN